MMGRAIRPNLTTYDTISYNRKINFGAFNSKYKHNKFDIDFIVNAVTVWSDSLYNPETKRLLTCQATKNNFGQYNDKIINYYDQTSTGKHNTYHVLYFADPIEDFLRNMNQNNLNQLWSIGKNIDIPVNLASSYSCVHKFMYDTDLTFQTKMMLIAIDN